MCCKPDHKEKAVCHHMVHGQPQIITRRQNFMKNIIKMLNQKIAYESPLVTVLGKVLEYLGLTINYTVKIQ